MSDYEKMGMFYLGREYDLASSEIQEPLVMYDSKDLTTHAVMIGMTGSGKTGLGISVLEEALMDNIPLLAIDPKGDLSNMLLSFENLDAESFKPWVNQQEATNKGMSVDEYAASQAKLWEDGLGEWGQDVERIRRLRSQAEMLVYTPGSSAGLPVSVLRSFDAPPQAVMEDGDMLRERIQSTATGLLALMGIEADPIMDPEHILIANILDHSWSEGKSLDIAKLIGFIQTPPFQRIGVMDLDMFYPARERFGLAMKLNALLAAPGFEAWMEGEPLDIQKMLYTPEGKPKACIFSINHLSDSERMFFVTMLLNALLAWMRTQPGTGSLRALLYMDEIYGYLPPTANPPSKTPMLTLLKQARAFGVGLVLSTQNPVDLDYKALSNIGTWFIGRLQTERDKARVLEGLEGASAGQEFDKQGMERVLAGLGKRVFLLHNVHENAPTIFHTRWAMSYLSGPMTREQLKVLTKDMKERRAAAAPALKQAQAIPASTPPQAQTVSTTDATPVQEVDTSAPPLMPQGVDVFYLSPSGTGQGVVYYPAVVGIMEVYYSRKTYDVEETRNMALVTEISDGPVSLDWDDAMEINIRPRDLEMKPISDVSYAEIPKDGNSSKSFTKWGKDLTTFVRQKRPLVLYQCKSPKMTSTVDETEGEFIARIRQQLREERDVGIEKLRKTYGDKIEKLGDKLQTAQSKIGREEDDVRQRQLESALSVGTTMLGALMGRKTVSVTNMRRANSSFRSMGRVGNAKEDVAEAREKVVMIQEDIDQMELELSEEVRALEDEYNMDDISVTELNITTTSTNITTEVFGMLWLPYRKDSRGRLSPDWE